MAAGQRRRSKKEIWKIMRTKTRTAQRPPCGSFSTPLTLETASWLLGSRQGRREPRV
jgi:hypothetical protein